MTKADNRAAAKAWHEERRRHRAAEARAEAVKAELVELNRLRSYLIRERTLGHTRSLIEAIDDYVEQITGGPDRADTKNHKCG